MDSLHNAEFYPVSLDELGGWLQFQAFQEVNLTFRGRPIKEWVFERRYAPNHFIRVYTGINKYGPSKNQSRKVGKDAIRVQAIHRNNGVDTLVNNQKRVHRVRGWKDNLKSRIKEILKEQPKIVLDSRGVPMVLRTNKYDGSKFWGSRDYPRNRETKSFNTEFYFDPEDPNRGYWDLDRDEALVNLANPRLEIKDIPSIIAHEIGHKVTGQGLVHGEQRYEEDYQNWLQLEMAAFLVQEEGDWDRARIRALFHPNCSFFIDEIGLEKWLNKINFEGNEDILEDGRNMLEWMNLKEAEINGPLNISVFGEDGYDLFKNTVEATLSHTDNKTLNAAMSAEDYEIRRWLKVLRDEDPDEIEVDWEGGEEEQSDWPVDWSAEEIELEKYDTTKPEENLNLDERIARMLRRKSKINEYGDIGCPVCESIDLFEVKILNKGKGYYCWWCGYERKFETIKARGDITLEKFGVTVKCPHCKEEIKAYNNAAFQRHLKKCMEE